MVALNHVDLDPRHDWVSLASHIDDLYACWKGHSIVPSTNRKPPSRCGHYEQVKLGTNWKCVACGEIPKFSERFRNSIDWFRARGTELKRNHRWSGGWVVWWDRRNGEQ